MVLPVEFLNLSAAAADSVEIVVDNAAGPTFTRTVSSPYYNNVPCLSPVRLRHLRQLTSNKRRRHNSNNHNKTKCKNADPLLLDALPYAEHRRDSSMYSIPDSSSPPLSLREGFRKQFAKDSVGDLFESQEDVDDVDEYDLDDYDEDMSVNTLETIRCKGTVDFGHVVSPPPSPPLVADAECMRMPCRKASVVDLVELEQQQQQQAERNCQMMQGVTLSSGSPVPSVSGSTEGMTQMPRRKSSVLCLVELEERERSSNNSSGPSDAGIRMPFRKASVVNLVALGEQCDAKEGIRMPFRKASVVNLVELGERESGGMIHQGHQLTGQSMSATTPAAEETGTGIRMPFRKASVVNLVELDEQHTNNVMMDCTTVGATTAEGESIRMPLRKASVVNLVELEAHEATVMMDYASAPGDGSTAEPPSIRLPLRKASVLSLVELEEQEVARMIDQTNEEDCGSVDGSIRMPLRKASVVNLVELGEEQMMSNEAGRAANAEDGIRMPFRKASVVNLVELGEQHALQDTSCGTIDHSEGTESCVRMPFRKASVVNLVELELQHQQHQDDCASQRVCVGHDNSSGLQSNAVVVPSPSSCCSFPSGTRPPERKPSGLSLVKLCGGGRSLSLSHINSDNCTMLPLPTRHGGSSANDVPLAAASNLRETARAVWFRMLQQQHDPNDATCAQQQDDEALVLVPGEIQDDKDVARYHHRPCQASPWTLTAVDYALKLSTSHE